MTDWADKDYKETKLIKQGKKSINSKFVELAEWINQKYNVQVINIGFEIMSHNKMPRLNIIFENYDDEKKFLTKKLEFHPIKQKAISDKCNQILLREQKIKFKSLFVIFSSFKELAISETNEEISQIEIDNFIKRLSIKELKKIERSFFHTVFFLETDEQIQEFTENGNKEVLRIEYVKLLKNYDEFNYLDEDKYPIHLDSIENLNKNYKGQFFLYLKG